MPQRLLSEKIWVGGKTKTAPQKYGAIHREEKVFASGNESSKFPRTPSRSRHQRPTRGTSPLRMFDSAQAISKPSIFASKRPNSVSEAGAEMVAVLDMFTLWFRGAATAVSLH